MNDLAHIPLSFPTYAGILAHVAELLGQLQQSNFRPNDLLFGRHGGGLQSAEAGRFATPTTPRPASAIAMPWGQTPHVRLNIS